MPMTTTIVLTDLPLETDIGQYGPGETRPTDHRLDLTLWIAAERVLIDVDDMAQVYDYDPLLATLEQLAGDGPYETQERLLTRMAEACAEDPAIEAVEIALRKAPIRPKGGAIGLRVHLDPATLASLRRRAV